MIKNIIIIIQFFALLILGWFLYIETTENKSKEKDYSKEIVKNNPYEKAELSYLPFKKKDSTWGYKILLSSDTLIIQPNKPGLPGNEGFITKEQAQIVAELVISKIRKGEMPPTVTIEELRELDAL